MTQKVSRKAMKSWNRMTTYAENAADDEIFTVFKSIGYVTI